MALAPLGPIFNASTVPLDKNPGVLPNLLQALLQTFQPLVFGIVTKRTVNFNEVEQVNDVTFMGVWQPASSSTINRMSQTLDMFKEGQRRWKWFSLITLPQPALSPDDVIVREGEQWRVIEKSDYTQYGFIEYYLVNDYTNSGPSIE